MARIRAVISLDSPEWDHQFLTRLMKTKLFACAAILALHGAAFAGGEGWSHDFEAAKKQAASEKKDLLMDFTGSDWCGWCIKLYN